MCWARSSSAGLGRIDSAMGIYDKQSVNDRVTSKGDAYVGEIGEGDIHMALDAGMLDCSGLPKLTPVGDWYP